MWALDNEENIEHTFLEAELAVYSILYFHCMSAENVSRRRRDESLSWKLAQSLLMEDKKMFRQVIREYSLILEALKLTSHFLS